MTVMKHQPSYRLQALNSNPLTVRESKCQQHIYTAPLLMQTHSCWVFYCLYNGKLATVFAGWRPEQHGGSKYHPTCRARYGCASKRRAHTAALFQELTGLSPGGP